MEYSSVDIYGVIIITGKDRGKTNFVRHRNIIMSRGRKPDITDIESSNNGGYYIAEIWPNIHLVIYTLEGVKLYFVLNKKVTLIHMSNAWWWSSYFQIKMYNPTVYLG